MEASHRREPLVNAYNIFQRELCVDRYPAQPVDHTEIAARWSQLTAEAREVKRPPCSRLSCLRVRGLSRLVQDYARKAAERNAAARASAPLRPVIPKCSAVEHWFAAAVAAGRRLRKNATQAEFEKLPALERKVPRRRTRH
jgi:hypothetical protein